MAHALVRRPDRSSRRWPLPRQPRRSSRRSRLLSRALPLAGCAIASFYFGARVAGAPRRAQHQIVAAYVTAFSHHDYARMYSLLSARSRARISERRFAAELRSAAGTASAVSLRPRRSFSIGGARAKVPFTIRTRMFGVLHEPLALALALDGGRTTIRFTDSLLFPGLRGRERLSRRSELGRRGTLLAADGEVLARGSALATPIPGVADQIVGTLGPVPADQRATYAARGYPPSAQVGLNGLEAMFQGELAGTPGGRLLAGARVLARVAPTAGATVRTTISPKLEAAVGAALGDTYSGMTVIDPHTGAVEAAVGLAFSVLQPPGSTFKIITSAAALEAHVASLDSVFPYQSTVSLDGFTMQNAGRERCGGTLLQAFAQSCNTVYAPLGARVGGRRLVATAERFGFNQPTGNAVVAESTIPSAATIGSPLAVGESAIGQGLVQATTLEMADVGATIANGGRRPIPTFRYGVRPRFVRAVSPRVAAQIQQMMIAVVSEGTGVSAQIPGVPVAGKTGTAELANTAGKQNDKRDTDAWFVGYAPAQGHRARVVACALFPANGFGADSAAPAVRKVLAAALAAG